MTSEELQRLPVSRPPPGFGTLMSLPLRLERVYSSDSISSQQMAREYFAALPSYAPPTPSDKALKASTQSPEGPIGNKPLPNKWKKTEWLYSPESNINIATSAFWFTSYTAFPSSLMIVDRQYNTLHKVRGIGKVSIEVKKWKGSRGKKAKGEIELYDFLYVPSFQANIISSLATTFSAKFESYEFEEDERGDAMLRKRSVSIKSESFRPIMARFEKKGNLVRLKCPNMHPTQWVFEEDVPIVYWQRDEKEGKLAD